MQLLVYYSETTKTAQPCVRVSSLRKEECWVFFIPFLLSPPQTERQNLVYLVTVADVVSSFAHTLWTLLVRCTLVDFSRCQPPVWRLHMPERALHLAAGHT